MTVSPTITLPPLGFGAANLGNMFREMSDEAAWAVLEQAWESGVRYFDTAPHYGLGLSERRLGAFLRTKPRTEFTISTKVGRLLRPNPEHVTGQLDTDNSFLVPTELRREWDGSAAGIRHSVEESLERMGLDRFDVLFLHDPERYDLEGALTSALPALERLRDSGVVDAVGVGSMSASALERCVVSAHLDLVMIAGRYTLLEQPAAHSVLPACVARGTRVVAASVYNSGLLASKEPTRDGRYEYGGVPEAVWERLGRIRAVCARFRVELPVAAMQFPLRHPSVVSVVMGGSRPEQVSENVRRAAEPVPESLWQELARQGLIDSVPEEEDHA